jgi:hypothetical protein
VDLGEAAGVDASGDGKTGLREAAVAGIYRRHGAAWKQAFIEWLGALNVANAGVDWWAYTSTAKNLLSSPLGNRLFQVLAVLKLVEETAFDRMYIVGASAAQRSVIRQRLARTQPHTAVREADAAAEFGTLELLARLAYQSARTALAVLWWRRRFTRSGSGILALTYVDGGVSDGNDAFFGRLPALLAADPHRRQLSFLAHVQAPYRRVLPRLRRFSQHSYWPILFELNATDLAAGLLKAWRARDTTRFRVAGEIEGVDATPLIREAFRWDIAKGGYLFNTLLYRAALRFARTSSPVRVLIPYENKSLEKTLLLGLREGAPGCRVIGYQHTSVTPRHTTLLFAAGEAAATPLPDLIVTAGDVARDYLGRHGNYPDGMLVTGCALRQSTGTALVPAGRGGRPRVLLALSSSRFELASAVEFFRQVEALGAEFDLAVRPHPEFPLRLLPATLQAWVAARARDCSGTALQENLAWCTAVAYASSTVALEAMMRGRPVINIDLGEMIVPDPALGEPPLWRRVSSPSEFVRMLQSLRALAPEALAAECEAATAYLQSYFRPVSPQALERFLL